MANENEVTNASQTDGSADQSHDKEEIAQIYNLYSSIKPNESVCFIVIAVILWLAAGISALIVLFMSDVDPLMLTIILSVCVIAVILGLFLFAFGKMIKVQLAILYKINSIYNETKKNNEE